MTNEKMAYGAGDGVGDSTEDGSRKNGAEDGTEDGTEEGTGDGNNYVIGPMMPRGGLWPPGTPAPLRAGVLRTVDFRRAPDPGRVCASCWVFGHIPQHARRRRPILRYLRCRTQPTDLPRPHQEGRETACQGEKPPFASLPPAVDANSARTWCVSQVVFFPEASDFIGLGKEEVLELTEQLDGPFVRGIQQAAEAEGIWISMGVHEQSNTPNTHVFNTHILISSTGHLVESYRKLHLFDVDIANGPRLLESSGTRGGDRIVNPVATPLGKIGLQICYDLRFAELSLIQRKREAEILTFPSAFTVKTGMAHWETLLRARAIETQCYVVAAAQVGQHNEKRASFGNAMIIDPWGTVLARCPDTTTPSLAFAEIDLEYLHKIRLEMPVLEHRRTDVYAVLD
ncbi:carbon-nitrogen hydrolase [Jimgerdemannia flammicorona]|uniref:Carbon-nitrogen hydrolase n=1 Tax=Jimgerdemannia flammicorona TaxID=994334 RepID=A0A433CX92_9FUNG|nr:carbon-nitrogen hydrolase [Jimgerdemannia flammicorona]